MSCSTLDESEYVVFDSRLEHHLRDRRFVIPKSIGCSGDCGVRNGGLLEIKVHK